MPTEAPVTEAPTKPVIEYKFSEGATNYLANLGSSVTFAASVEPGMFANL